MATEETVRAHTNGCGGDGANGNGKMATERESITAVAAEQADEECEWGGPQASATAELDVGPGGPGHPGKSGGKRRGPGASAEPGGGGGGE